MLDYLALAILPLSIYLIAVGFRKFYFKELNQLNAIVFYKKMQGKVSKSLKMKALKHGLKVIGMVCLILVGVRAMFWVFPEVNLFFFKLPSWIYLILFSIVFLIVRHFWKASRKQCN